MRSRLCNNRNTVIYFNDVNDLDQIEVLGGLHDWFDEVPHIMKLFSTIVDMHISLSCIF